MVIQIDLKSYWPMLTFVTKILSSKARYRQQMKIIILSLSLVFMGFLAQAQNGLENIIIEKYYIADANDAAAEKTNTLKTGAVTYRIYVDMLPGYRFQAAYGIPGHELKIATTTFFYNSENGSSVANDITLKDLSTNTLMLDSWLSVGAGCSGAFGLIKSDDDTTKTIKNLNNPVVLQNTNMEAGIPIKERDGLKIASPQSVVTLFGIEKEVEIFGNKSEIKSDAVFSTANGSWASFGGAIGPNSDNKVLIAQITTDGKLSFELNIQLGSPKGGIENFVAKNPVGKEVSLEYLSYPSIQKN